MSLKVLISNPYMRGLLFLCGALLLGLDVIGRTHSLRNPEIYHIRHNLFTNDTDVVLTEKQFYEAIKRYGESDQEYMIKATMAVNQGLVHYFPQDGTDVAKYYYLPPSENYLLWLSRYISLAWKIPLGYKVQDVLWYRFANWRKSVERGVGLCGTHALVLMEVLHLNHIPARAVYILHHVIVEASPDQGKTWWILDPDYGVVIPESMQALRAQPEVIGGYFKAKGYGPAAVESVQKALTGGEVEFKYSAIDMHGRRKVYFEYASYCLIWLIPVVLMLPSLADFLSALRRSPKPLRAMLSPVRQGPTREGTAVARKGSDFKHLVPKNPSSIGAVGASAAQFSNESRSDQAMAAAAVPAIGNSAKQPPPRSGG